MNNFEIFLRNKETCDNTVNSIIEGNYPFSDVLNKNINHILANAEKVNLFLLRDYLKDNKKTVKKINKAIDEKNELEIKTMISDYIQQTYSKYVKENEIILNKAAADIGKILDFVYLVIMDICKNEEVTPSALKLSGSGMYCLVFRIGEKVMKLGYERETEEFHNNPYIVKPLLRRKINLAMPFWIEVTQVVDVDRKVSKTAAYQFYKRVRENTGLIFDDIKLKNLGYLKKDNIIHWKSPLCPTDESLMLSSYVGDEELTAGEIVMFDADYIYDEDEQYPTFYEQYLFETKYQYELAEKRNGCKKQLNSKK